MISACFVLFWLLLAWLDFIQTFTQYIPKSSDIFKLKRKYKNLTVDEYATNLKIYLTNVTSNASVTFDDFSQVLDDL